MCFNRPKSIHIKQKTNKQSRNICKQQTLNVQPNSKDMNFTLYVIAILELYFKMQETLTNLSVCP